MTHLEIALSISTVVLLLLFLGTVVYNSLMSSSQQDLYTHYKVLWSKAEQDNKWLRSLCQVTNPVVDTQGPQLGEEVEGAHV